MLGLSLITTRRLNHLKKLDRQANAQNSVLHGKVLKQDRHDGQEIWYWQVLKQDELVLKCPINRTFKTWYEAKDDFVFYFPNVKVVVAR